MRAGDYMHHPVGATPLAEESFMNIPRYTLTLHPEPCTLHPEPCTLHPTPYTLHPAPRTLHPDYMHHPVGATLLAEESFMNIPRYTLTLHPEPCTLHPEHVRP